MEKSKVIKVNNKDYKIQNIGLMAYLNMMDDYGSKRAEMANQVLEHIVIEPKGLTVDDFTGDYKTLNGIVLEVNEMILGNGKPKK